MTAVPSTSGDAASTDDDDALLGSVIDGRYRIDTVLGAGGMGRVYLGQHVGIGRPVAIKVLHAAFHRNREAATRFQREALASGRLDHGNIVSVSDFGTLESGACFLVMEALEGESLGERLLREGRLPWREALALLRDVLGGLAHAHDRGVVHRDIKPDNIYLARKDGAAVVKILDFGIAKLYAGSADDPASTGVGLTIGTPAYLSPEQAAGGEITPSSDLYSATVVLFELVTGRAPFEEDEPLAMLGAHVTRPAPLARDLAPELDLPVALDELLQHGLAKRPAHRMASAVAYLERVDALLAAPDLVTAPRAHRARTPSTLPQSAIASTVPGTGVLLPVAMTHAPSGVGPSPSRRPSSEALGGLPTARHPRSTPTPVPVVRPPTASGEPHADGAVLGTASTQSLASRMSLASLGATPKRWQIIIGLVLIAIIPLVVSRLRGHPTAIVGSQSGSTGAMQHFFRARGSATATSGRAAVPPKHGGAPSGSASGTSAGAKPATAIPPGDPGPGSATPEPIVAPEPIAVPTSAAERQAMLKAALWDLQNGKTCALRRAAIPRLVALDEPAAVKPLQRARSRMVGGVLGLGSSNSNGCLVTDAKAAITTLKRAR